MCVCVCVFVCVCVCVCLCVCDVCVRLGEFGLCVYVCLCMGGWWVCAPRRESRLVSQKSS